MRQAFVDISSESRDNIEARLDEILYLHHWRDRFCILPSEESALIDSMAAF